MLVLWAFMSYDCNLWSDYGLGLKFESIIFYDLVGLYHSQIWIALSSVSQYLLLIHIIEIPRKGETILWMSDRNMRCKDKLKI